jgi:hypothetical protein
MTEIVLGTNRFVDCEQVVVIDGTPLFSVRTDEDRSLLASLDIASPPARQPVKVRENNVLSGSVRVETREDETLVLLQESCLLSARRTKGGFDVSLDLRPVGLGIYSDANSLHLGASAFSGNWFHSKTGIQLTTK